MALKRLVNLTTLNLIGYHSNTINVTQNIFKSIRRLKKLTRLGLLNIHCDVNVIKELEKCDNIKILFINPTRVSILLILFIYIYLTLLNRYIFFSL